MTKINAFSLGGLNEIGKNCFIIEIDKDIFIFDCGSKVLAEIDLGVNTLIPDFNYLKENKSRIKGVFITKIDINNAFGLSFLLNKIGDVKIYLSEVSSQILKKENILTENQIKKNVTVIDDKKFKFNSTYINNFYTASNIPGSCGYSIETPNGYIVYTGSFLFENNIDSHFFNTQFGKIITNKKKSVLLLITNVSQVHLNNFTVPYNSIQKWLIKSLMKVENNLIICCDQYDWHKIHQVFTELKEFNEKKINFSFFDSQFEEKFVEVMKPFLKSLNINKFIPLNDLKRKNDEINVIFLTGNHKWLFSRIHRLINNKNPNLSLTAKDFILILGESYFNNELSMIKTLNNLTKKEAEVEFVNNKKILPNEASAEDIKLLINLLKPKYFWPNNTYHKNLEKAKMLAIKTGIEEKNIFVCENGEIIHFENDQKKDKYKFLELESIFVDNLANANITSNVIWERKTLAEEGVIFIAFSYHKQNVENRLLSEIKIKSFGLTEEKIKLENIKIEINKIILNLLRHNKGNTKKDLFIREIKKEIGKVINKKLRKNPLILPVLIPF